MFTCAWRCSVNIGPWHHHFSGYLCTKLYFWGALMAPLFIFVVETREMVLGMGPWPYICYVGAVPLSSLSTLEILESYFEAQSSLDLELYLAWFLKCWHGSLTGILCLHSRVLWQSVGHRLIHLYVLVLCSEWCSKWAGQFLRTDWWMGSLSCELCEDDAFQLPQPLSGYFLFDIWKKSRDHGDNTMRLSYH